MLFYIVLFAATVLLYKWWFGGRARAIRLPGPDPWPLVGNTLQMSRTKPHLTLDKWHKQHNKVYKFRNLGEETVVVGSTEALTEVLVKRGADFAGRPRVYRMDLLANFSPDWQDGIVFNNPDATWKLLRQTVQKNIKQFDRGLERIEEVVSEVSDDLVRDIRSRQGQAFNPRNLLLNAIMNNITIFLLGRKFSEEETLFREFVKIEQLALELFSPVGEHALIDVFPWLRFFGNETPKLIGHYKSAFDLIYEEMKRTLVRAEEGDENKPILQEILELLDAGQIVPGGEERVVNVCSNLIFGGSGTSTSTLYALLNILTHYPDVQDKLQNEVDEVLGERRVKVADKETMPYTRATLLENLRYAAIFPMMLPHMALRDTSVSGVHVPRGTPVLCNNYSTLHDEDYWEEPYTFKPERFLDDDGQVVPADHINRVRLMAFGAGPRVCVGEMFAMTRMFLLIATIVQNFRIEQEEPRVSCHPEDYELAIVSTPPDFMAKMIPRHG